MESVSEGASNSLMRLARTLTDSRSTEPHDEVRSQFFEGWGSDVRKETTDLEGASDLGATFLEVESDTVAIGSTYGQRVIMWCR